MAIVVKKNTKYASANWQVELYTGETKLDADVLGLNITLKKGSISNPFSEVMANSCTLKTSYILIKGQQVAVHFVYDDDDVEVFNGYVEDADYDSEVFSYTLYSEDTRYNVLCPTLDWSDYPSYDGTYKKSVTLNWIIEQGCTKLGLPVPDYMPYDFECSTDSAFIEYQKYTMAQLISFYNASCAIMGYDTSFISRTSPILLVENCMDGGFSSKFSYDGIRNVYIKQKAVIKKTEVQSDVENGIAEHEVSTNSSVDYHVMLNLKGGKMSCTTQTSEPTEIDDNYIKIENPIPFGNSTRTAIDATTSLSNFYYGEEYFEQFLTAYASTDLSEKSVETFFVPEFVSALGKVVAVVDYDNESYLNGDNYIIDDDGADEFYNSFYMKFPLLQIDIDYDGGVSCKLSTGGGLSSGVSTTNTATTDMVTIVGSSSGTATVAESLARLQNQIADLVANGITANNFDEYLANVDYLTLQSAFISSIQAETITTDYLKASEAHLDWAEILKATIDNAMIKDASIDNAKIQDATIEYAKVSEAFIDELTTDSIFVEKLEASLANIDILTANSAIIKNLQAETAKIADLEVEVAKIESLEAGVAKIADLEAKVANIDYLEADVASINTLMFGSATGDVIQTEFSNSVIAQLGDAQIKSAMIESISASKITSGSIYTNVVHIYGDDTNKLSIVDNTISISDGIRTRVQIGKDASSDYNMYVWDGNGNLMFDALGLTENGVNRQIIRDDMVKDNANISAEKLNIDTLFSVINNDASRTLKSSKIYVDADGQTLDISFKTLTSSVTTATETATNATSTAQQAYDMAEFANGTADSAYDLAEDASTTAESANETAKSNASKITTLTTTVTSQGTDISAIQGQISSKVWQQDITTAVEVAIDELEVGGTNLLVRSTTVPTYLSTSGGTLSDSSATHNSSATGDITSDWIDVSAYDSVVITLYDTFTDTVHSGRYCLYNSSKTVLSTTNYNPRSPQSIIVDTSSASYMRITAISCLTYRYKIEKGNKATDWSPSPLDTDNKVTTLSTKYSELVQTTDSISAKVSSMESNLSSNYSTTTEMNSAITATKSDILLSVSNTYATTSQLGEVNGNFAKYSTTAQMNSAIALKANEITSTVSATYTTKTEFNALEVGGRNLLVGSATYNFAQGVTSGSFKHSVVDDSGFFSGKHIEILCTGSGGFYSHNSGNVTGRTYTYSFWAKCSTEKTVKVGYERGGIKYINLTTEWQFYEHTFTADSNSLSALVWYVSNGSWQVGDVLYISNFKVEYGNKATSWTPAPEDVESEITSVETIATQTAEKFQWVVKSGTSSSDFEITDRMATLTANYINLNGLVTFNGLNSELRTKVSDAYSWTSSYGTSMTNVAKMVANWADGAISSTTTINGGLISTNTITAEKIALGDFTNYITANEKNSTSMIPTSVFGGTTISSGYICKPTATNQYLMFNNYTPCAFRSGDVLYFRATLKRATSASLSVCMWFYNSSKACVATITGTTVTVGTSDTTVTASFSITAKASTASCFVIGIADGASTYSQIYAKNAQLIRRYTGELLVDGTITAGKIASSAITADKIASGAITAAKIAAGTITADKINLTDLFSQSITASNLNITGGSVNITTSDKEDSCIELENKEGSYYYTSYMKPYFIGACRQVSSSGSIRLDFDSYMMHDRVCVSKLGGSTESYSELQYDGVYTNGYQLFAPAIIKSGSISYGSTLTVKLTSNALYIVFLQSWTIENAFGMYAFMCTSGNYVTTIAAAQGQSVTLTSDTTLKIYNSNSNGSTYYKIVKVF